MRIAVSRELIAQRAGELLAHTYVPILDRFTFSSFLRIHKVLGILIKDPPRTSQLVHWIL
jgi:hypothetical protein